MQTASTRHPRMAAGAPPAATVARRRSHGIGVAGITALLLALVALLPLVVRPLDVEAYYLAFVLLALTLVPIVIRAASDTFDVFEPIIPLSLLIALAFGVRAMYLAYDPVTLSITRLSGASFDDFMARALAVAIAAYCALVVGYFVLGGWLWHRLHAARGAGRAAWAPRQVSTAKLLILVGIGGVAMILRITRGELPGAVATEIGNLTFVLATLSSSVQYAACILALYIAAGDRRGWLRILLWLVVVPVAAFQALAFSGKAPVLLSLYAVVAAWHYTRRPIRLPVLAAWTVPLVLLVFPTVNAFRTPLDKPLSVSFTAPTLSEMVTRLWSLPSEFAGMSAAEYVQVTAASLVGRSNGIDSLALIMKYGDGVAISDPSVYWQIPLLAFVPRAIWPDKPVIATGTEFARLFVSPRAEMASEHPSIGVYHVGDLYAGFGFAGVLIGMCLLGCLYRFIYAWFDPARSPDLGRKFLYIVLLWYVVSGFEADIPTIYGNVLKGLLIWGLIKLWFNARPREAQPVASRAAAANPRGAPLRPRAAFSTAARLR